MEKLFSQGGGGRAQGCLFSHLLNQDRDGSVQGCSCDRRPTGDLGAAAEPLLRVAGLPASEQGGPCAAQEQASQPGS